MINNAMTMHTSSQFTLSIHDVAENFALFDDWEDRYRYLIDLGRQLPHMDNTLKTDNHLVRGCTSRVWLVPHVKDGILHFEADSDAHIVRGLVALLYAAYQGVAVKDIPTIDINAIFTEIGLDTHLSANRRSGFLAMVDTIRHL